MEEKGPWTQMCFEPRKVLISQEPFPKFLKVSVMFCHLPKMSALQSHSLANVLPSSRKESLKPLGMIASLKDLMGGGSSWEVMQVGGRLGVCRRKSPNTLVHCIHLPFEYLQFPLLPARRALLWKLSWYLSTHLCKDAQNSDAHRHSSKLWWFDAGLLSVLRGEGAERQNKYWTIFAFCLFS